ncbi:hypothetical protein [Caballeronia novacaledonica]|uniref:Uncharacterized protein n=1 Tax=Caballeronia novacaledonica TaxID=1544861 RepID=A0AA37IGR0_9BURK|nr:hypothetical protein [Caballeronia novacaledonica]GJH28897.1 hypothetical protein CBA19CS42_30295 [Caballeronia novacaledonica]
MSGRVRANHADQRRGDFIGRSADAAWVLGIEKVYMKGTCVEPVQRGGILAAARMHRLVRVCEAALRVPVRHERLVPRA